MVVNAARRVPVVEYSLNKTLTHFTSDRAGLLSKCTAIDLEMAKKLLDHGYKQLSKFKRWCPVEVCGVYITDIKALHYVGYYRNLRTDATDLGLKITLTFFYSDI